MADKDHFPYIDDPQLKAAAEADRKMIRDGLAEQLTGIIDDLIYTKVMKDVLTIRPPITHPCRACGAPATYRLCTRCRDELAKGRG